MKEITIKNNRLELTLCLCQGGEYDTTRFDKSCRIRQITLDGKHSFAEPEQRLASRRTANGYGISAEWVIEDLGTDTKAGQYFYKPGVGSLLQEEDNAPYDIFTPYRCLPDRLDWEASEDFIDLSVKNDMLGLSIHRSLKLEENKLLLTTCVSNHGENPISMMEYQHNFFSLDKALVGPGYHLDLPYIKDLTDRTWESSILDGQGVACGSCPSPLFLEPHRVNWKEKMDGNAYYVSFSSRDIQESASEYKWLLSTNESSSSVSETMGFRPCRQDVWGVEHLVCAEGFKEVRLAPGQSDTYQRIWEFKA